ncbi:MAG: amidohydrolase [Tissierellia bacterium]|nr:amidohydrolase [Tissierellia bacterium]
MNILIKNIDYLDILKETVVNNKDILIKENKIVKIGSNLKVKNVEVMDGQDKLAIPGLINSHTHLGMAMFRNYADDMELMDWLENKIWPIENHLSSEDIYWSSLLSMAEMIRSGTTTFCDMYYGMERVADATIESGMRGLLTRGLTDIGGGGKERLQNLEELYRRYHNSGKGRIRIAPGPHAIYTCSRKYLEEIVQLTEKMDGILHIHLSETETEVENSIKEHGMTPIEYIHSIGMTDLHVIAAHCVHITEKEMEIIGDRPFYPVYNPTSNLKLASGFAPVKALLEGGITMGLGTDGSSSNNNQNMLEEIHIASIVNKAVTMDPKAVPAIEVLKMATIHGAKSLGFENLGAIEEGYLADIVLLDLNSNQFTPRNERINALCYSANSSDVSDVIIDGNIIMRNRELLTLDETIIRMMVTQRWNDLLDKYERV